MIKNTRTSIYAGVNFIVAPLPALTIEKRLEFQRQLDELGILATDINFENQRLSVIRGGPMPLEVSIGAVAPQIGQILIIAPQVQKRSLEGFGREARDVANIFVDLWPQRQIISCDATIRDLYDSSGEHAFKEIWELRLKQPPNSLVPLGRSVLGGGLRFVMPPTSDDPKDPLIELKVESFLQDTKKLFLEAQVTWGKPQLPGTALDPENRLLFVDNFLQTEAIKFVMEE